MEEHLTSRNANDGEHMGLQVGRGAAALLVTWHHALETSYPVPGQFKQKWLVLYGAVGVDIFFVISGFIMMYTTYRKHHDGGRVRVFLARRVMRVYPLYWLCCAATLLLWTVGFFRNQPYDTELVLRSVLLLPSEPQLITQAWTLVYEMMFYVIFAATLILNNARTSFIASTTCLIALCAIGLVLPNGVLARFLSNNIVLEFGFGLALGLWYLKRQRGLASPWLLLASATAVGVAAHYFPSEGLGGLQRPWRVVGWGLPSAAVVGVCLAYKSIRGPIPRLLARLGDSSYALYLTHGFVCLAFAKGLKTFPWLAAQQQWWLIAMVVTLAVCVGEFTHSVVEKPLLKALKRRFAAPAPAFYKRRTTVT